MCPTRRRQRKNGLLPSLQEHLFTLPSPTWYVLPAPVLLIHLLSLFCIIRYPISHWSSYRHRTTLVTVVSISFLAGPYTILNCNLNILQTHIVLHRIRLPRKLNSHCIILQIVLQNKLSTSNHLLVCWHFRLFYNEFKRYENRSKNTFLDIFVIFKYCCCHIREEMDRKY